MATGRILDRFSRGQIATLSGSEFIISMWSRGSALNYPVVGFTASTPLIDTYIEKISYSMNAGQVEVYAAINIAALAAASNSSIRLFGKKLIDGNAVLQGSIVFGEITPGQYSALIFGEDLYTRKTADGVFDFEQSNILLRSNPNVGGSTSSVLIAGIGAATELFASFDMKQINPNNN